MRQLLLRLSTVVGQLRPRRRRRRIRGCQSTNHTLCYGELWQCSVCGKTVCYAEGTDDDPTLCDDCWVRAHPDLL
jgi:hypothetical protein